MMMNDCYCMYWKLFLCPPMIDLQHQRVHWRQHQSQMSALMICEQQRAREDCGRTWAGWRGRVSSWTPDGLHRSQQTRHRPIHLLKITTTLQWIQIVSSQQQIEHNKASFNAKACCTPQISVFRWNIPQSFRRGVQSGMCWTQPRPDFHHSTITHVQKSLWEVLCQIKSLSYSDSGWCWRSCMIESTTHTCCCKPC